MGVEHLGAFGEEALLYEVDHPLHGFALIHWIGDHRLGACWEADRLIGLAARHAVGWIRIVLENDDLVVTNRAAELDQFGRVVDDLTHLRAQLLRRAGAVDADHAMARLSAAKPTIIPAWVDPVT